MGSSDQARRTRRPGREAGTQAREGERAGHFGADGDCEVALPARDSGFLAGMTAGLPWPLIYSMKNRLRGLGAQDAFRTL